MRMAEPSAGTLATASAAAFSAAARSLDPATAAGAEPAGSGPKSAFGRIVLMVERSLFGGRTLEEHDWKACREAYQEFAFASAWKE